MKNSKEIAMRRNIVQIAEGIEGFKHLDALVRLMNESTVISKNSLDKCRMLEGYLLIVKEIKANKTLQLDTMLQTANNVKKQFAIRSNFNHTLKDINALTLAIAHTKHCINKWNKAKILYSNQKKNKGIII